MASVARGKTVISLPIANVSLVILETIPWTDIYN